MLLRTLFLDCIHLSLFALVFLFLVEIFSCLLHVLRSLHNFLRHIGVLRLFWFLIDSKWTFSIQVNAKLGSTLQLDLRCRDGRVDYALAGAMLGRRHTTAKLACFATQPRVLRYYRSVKVPRAVRHLRVDVAWLPCEFRNAGFQIIVFILRSEIHLVKDSDNFFNVSLDLQSAVVWATNPNLLQIIEWAFITFAVTA